MKHVMIDLETLGKAPGCTILSIGAVLFSSEGSLYSHTTFNVQAISRASCSYAGLFEDQDTLEWWRQQLIRNPDPTVGLGLNILERCSKKTAMSIGSALYQLAYWFDQVSPDIKDLRVWGNGADFDLPILSEAYVRCGQDVPWAPYAGRCYRTLKNLRPDIQLVRVGAHHDALDDAKSQAEHAVRLLNDIGGW